MSFLHPCVDPPTPLCSAQDDKADGYLLDKLKNILQTIQKTRAFWLVLIKQLNPTYGYDHRPDLLIVSMQRNLRLPLTREALVRYITAPYALHRTAYRSAPLYLFDILELVLNTFNHEQFHRLFIARNINNKTTAIFISQLSIKVLRFFINLCRG